MQSTLNNPYLDEAPMPAATYNKLPHIDSMRDAAMENANAHAQLLGLIASNGLAETFSVHLVHKHFDIPNGRIMVYEGVKGKDHPEFFLCSPRDPATFKRFRGLYFKATSNAKMVAYEYTTDPGEDLSGHANFVSTFAQAVLDLGVQDIFALTVKKTNHGVLSEFEMADLLSTVLVKNPTWLPAESEPGQTTATDWVATSDYAAYANGGIPNVPGIITLKCMKTRSTRHINVTCSRTRSGKHYQQKRASGDGDDLLLDGQVLPKGSEAHCIISRARAMIEAW